MKATTQQVSRWNAPSNTAVRLTGVVVAAGSASVAPKVSSKNCLIYGDSITEGLLTINEATQNDTDRGDAMAGYAWRLGDLLGWNIGIVAFGGSGLTVGGGGNVPPLTTTWNMLYDGQARSFLPKPTLSS